MSLSPHATWHVAFAILILALPGCRKSQTTKDIVGFAEKVCACKDKPCAEAVQTEYLEWWKSSKRARGSEDDRKAVEKAMQRYAECHLALVGPEEDLATEAPVVPKVNLEPAAMPSPPVKAIEEPQVEPTKTDVPTKE